MQKRSLGQTDIAVSVLGLGTVKFGRNEGVKYPSPFTLPSDRDLSALLRLAKENGINLLDTAPAYGSSEERLGYLLKGERQDWVIVTKAGEEWSDRGSLFDFSRQALLASVERSLKRLHTDYLDVVLVHSSGEDLRLIQEEKVFETLTDLKQAGKIRAFGMSGKTVAGGMLTVEQADVAMVTFNLNETDERAVIESANQKNKGILVKKALASGHSPCAKQALRFALAEPGVSSIVVGTINPMHLKENLLCVA